MKDSQNFDFHYGKYFHTLSNKLKRLGDENLQKKNITFSQLRVLVFVSKNSNKEGVLQNDIEKEFKIRGSSVTSILKNMEKSGVIKRVPDKSDNRIKRVFITSEGEKLNEDLKNYLMNIDSEIDRGFSSEERETFRFLLKKALDNIEKLESKEGI